MRRGLSRAISRTTATSSRLTRGDVAGLSDPCTTVWSLSQPIVALHPTEADGRPGPTSRPGSIDSVSFFGDSLDLCSRTLRTHLLRFT